ncbi:MAG: DinB family protein [Bacteroidetes bacterium]|nr:DinB family protein [Bacteroidota bacterium]MCH8326439.1 DinB family protein [Bacteroidota bacterium]
MKRYSLNLFVAATVLFFSFTVVSAKGIENSITGNGIIKDFQKNLKDAQEKILSLAEEIPEKDYSWKPSEGVRTVGESLVHVAVGNFFIMQYLGFKSNEKISFSLEKEITKKTDIIALLKKSFKFNNKNINKVDEKQLDVEVDFFNKQKATKRYVLLSIITHNHEHLGQLIAYARSVGVVPPWSQKKK